MEKDGKELVLNIALRSNSSTAVYQAMQDMWKAIGVHVEIELMENTSDARDSGEFDFISGGWQTVNNADGQSYLKNRWSDNGSDNYTDITVMHSKRLWIGWMRHLIIMSA